MSQVILEWRRLNAVLTKVVFPYQRECVYNKRLSMNRVHGVTQFHTATGRVSMSEPNIQNIPRNFDIDVHGKLSFLFSSTFCFCYLLNFSSYLIHESEYAMKYRLWTNNFGSWNILFWIVDAHILSLQVWCLPSVKALLHITNFLYFFKLNFLRSVCLLSKQFLNSDRNFIHDSKKNWN